MSESAAIAASPRGASTSRSSAGGIAANGGKAQPPEGKTPPISAANVRARELDRVVEQLNSKSKSIGRAIRFRVDPGSTQPIIQVFDRDTGRLIRQIPSNQAAVLAKNQELLDLERIIDVV